MAEISKRPCPTCAKTGRFLVDSSANAYVDYYRCDFCGNVWVLDRGDQIKPPRLVTQRPTMGSLLRFPSSASPPPGGSAPVAA